VYLLHGEEEFLIERAARELANTALGDGDASFNLDTFRGSEHKAEDVTAASNSFPFMSERRVVIVKECEKFHSSPVLASYIQRPNPDCVLILCAGDGKTSGKRKSTRAKKSADIPSLIQKLEQERGPAASIEFKALKDAAAQQWIVKEFARAEKRISPDACVLFNAIIGTDTRNLASAIEKILTAAPDKPCIEKEEIYEHLGTSPQYNVFELANAVSARDARKAHDIVAVLLKTEEPIVILNVLYRQLSLLWRVRALRIEGRANDEHARAIGLYASWQVDNLRPFLKFFSDSSYFDRCFEYILEADLAIKSLPVDPDTAIVQLVTRLTESR